MFFFRLLKAWEFRYMKLVFLKNPQKMKTVPIRGGFFSVSSDFVLSSRPLRKRKALNENTILATEISNKGLWETLKVSF